MAYELFLQWQLCCHRSRDPQIYCPPLWSSSGYNFASGSLLLVNAFLTVDDLSIDWKEWRWFLLLILWRSSYFSLLPHLSSLSAWIFCKTEWHRPSINQVFNSFNPRNDLQSIYQVTSHPFPQSRWQAHSCLDQVSLCPQYNSKPEYGKRQDPLERCRGVLDETCRLSGDNDCLPRFKSVSLELLKNDEVPVGNLEVWVNAQNLEEQKSLCLWWVVMTLLLCRLGSLFKLSESFVLVTYK